MALITPQEVADIINATFPEGPDRFAQALGLFRMLGDRTVLEETIAKKKQDQAAATQAAETEIQTVQAELAAIQNQITNTVG